MKRDLSDFENKIGIKFKNSNLLVQAFTHRSYINEHPEEGLEHNERLEFLGDAVLELVVSEFLFKKYPKRPEGELTSLRAAVVNTGSIAECGAGLGMDELLLLSRGEAKDRGRARQVILANAFEALVGAIYLDQGYGQARDFLTANLLAKIDAIVEKKLWRDAKSLFQEIAQEKVGLTPTYQSLKELGPDHARRFTVGVYLGKELVAQGEGFSKQEAETVAAEKALAKKGWR